MGKYEKLLGVFFKETDFLNHSTAYEARTVLEFAQWLDKQDEKETATLKELDKKMVDAVSNLENKYP